MIGVDILEHIRKLDGELLSKANNVGLNHMNVGFENGVPINIRFNGKGTIDDVSDFLKLL